MPEPTNNPAPPTPPAAPPKEKARSVKVIQWPTFRPAMQRDAEPHWFAIVEVDGKQKELTHESFDKLTAKLNRLQEGQGE